MRFFCLNRLQAGAVYTKILRRFVPQPSTTPPGFSPRFRQPTCANFEKTGSRRRTQTKKCHHKKTSKKRFFCLMFTKKKAAERITHSNCGETFAPVRIVSFKGQARKIPDGSWIRWGSFSLMQEKDKGIKFPVQGAMKLHTFNKKAVGVVFVCFF